MTDGETWEIRLWIDWGFHGTEIARLVFGNGSRKYTPSASEVAKVYRVASKYGVRLRDYRDGKGDGAFQARKRVSIRKGRRRG